MQIKSKTKDILSLMKTKLISLKIPSYLKTRRKNKGKVQMNHLLKIQIWNKI